MDRLLPTSLLPPPVGRCPPTRLVSRRLNPGMRRGGACCACSCGLVLIGDALGFLRVPILLQSAVTGGDVVRGCAAARVPWVPSAGHAFLVAGRAWDGEKPERSLCWCSSRYSESVSQAPRKRGNWVKTHQYSCNSPSSACFSLCEPPKEVPSSFVANARTELNRQ